MFYKLRRWWGLDTQNFITADTIQLITKIPWPSCLNQIYISFPPSQIGIWPKHDEHLDKICHSDTLMVEIPNLIYKPQ